MTSIKFSAKEVGKFNNLDEVRKYYDDAIVKAYEKYKTIDPLRLRMNEEQRLAFQEYLNTRDLLEEQKREMLKLVKEKIVSVDDKGNPLSIAQQKYFRGSKVVDENGRLKICYHGTDTIFNEFSYKFLGRHSVVRVTVCFSELFLPKKIITPTHLTCFCITLPRRLRLKPAC